MEDVRAFKVSTAATAIISASLRRWLVVLLALVYESYQPSVRRTKERAIAGPKDRRRERLMD